VLFGYFHCRAHAFNYAISCKDSQCVWKTTNVTTPPVSFPKSDLIAAEIVRIDAEGVFVDPSRLKEKGRFGYTVRLKIRLPIEEGSRIKTEKLILFAPYDLSRRTSKIAVSKINAYLGNKETTGFHYSRGRMISAVGAISIFIGMASLLLSCILGTWIEVNPRKMKKAS
jgi:hypothetical protein